MEIKCIQCGKTIKYNGDIYYCSHCGRKIDFVNSTMKNNFKIKEDRA